jgi:hypothetical protein
MENPAPILEKLLKENELPILSAPKSDNEAPIREVPNIETSEATRANARSDKELPSDVRWNKESEAPIRNQLLRDNVAPS